MSLFHLHSWRTLLLHIKIYVDRCFPRSTLNMSSHCLTACVASDENSEIIFILVPLHIKHLPHPAAFNIFSLSLVFRNLTLKLYQGGVYFVFILLGSQRFSDLCIDIFHHVLKCFSSVFEILLPLFPQIFFLPLSPLLSPSFLPSPSPSFLQLWLHICEISQYCPSSH